MLQSITRSMLQSVTYPVGYVEAFRMVGFDLVIAENCLVAAMVGYCRTLNDSQLPTKSSTWSTRDFH